MVLTKMNITFVIDEEDACEYTVEGTTSEQGGEQIRW
jgi:hypothetical protein